MRISSSKWTALSSIASSQAFSAAEHCGRHNWLKIYTDLAGLQLRPKLLGHQSFELTLLYSCTGIGRP